MSNLAHLKRCCAGCKQSGVPMNKEHIFPEWLIERTGTNATGIRWLFNKKIPASSATIPLCTRCNSDFADQLENPTKNLFDDIEAGRGISDFEVELFVRWLWKIKGMAWIANHPQGRYSRKGYSLRERVLLPIEEVRNQLTFAIALIKNVQPEFGDSPMGVDSITHYDANFVSGVFSRIAVMVLLKDFVKMVPPQFKLYQLAPERSEMLSGKFIIPPVSFADCVEAVAITKSASVYLSNAHDQLAKLRLQTMMPNS